MLTVFNENFWLNIENKYFIARFISKTMKIREGSGRKGKFSLRVHLKYTLSINYFMLIKFSAD